MKSEDAKIFFGVPSYRQIEMNALPSIVCPAYKAKHLLVPAKSSLPGDCFNELLCLALNSKFVDKEFDWSHFVMHHSDVEAEAGFADIMVDEMERVGADILSVVLPTRDKSGRTSTAIFDRAIQFARHLTLYEIYEGIPEATFSVKDIQGFVKERYQEEYPNGYWDGDHSLPLFVNTGLLMMKMDDWICEFALECAFNISTTIEKRSGRFVKKTIGEDWGMSDWAHRRGLKVFATRIVKANHWGDCAYTNTFPWGQAKETMEPSGRLKPTSGV